jgi:ABC-type sugar transport system ATPase subunit
MLEVSSLTVVVPRGKVIITDIGFFLGKGEMLAVFGPSGSGKSTLLNAIAGFIDVDPPAVRGQIAARKRFLNPKWFEGSGRLSATGDIRIDGASIVEREAQERPVGLVLQRFGVYPHMTAFSNIAFPLRCRGIENEQVKERVAKAAEMAGVLPEQLTQKVKDLSGGEAQRVAIAKMLAKGAGVALMDEPFSHLDQVRRSDLIELIRSLVRSGEEGMDCAVMISHDWRELRYADQAMLLNARGDGQKVGRIFGRQTEDRSFDFELAGDALPLDAHEQKWVDGLKMAVAALPSC